MNIDPDRLSPLQLVACAIHSRLPGVEWKFGKAGSKEHGERRRYDWVRANTAAEISERVGPGPEGDDYTAPTAGHPVDLISTAWTLQEAAAVKVYGESDGAMSCMVRNFIVVAQELFGPNWRLQRVEWGEDKPDGASQRNQVAVIRCWFALPIEQERQELRHVGGYEDVCGWLEDDGTVTPQS